MIGLLLLPSFFFLPFFMVKLADSHIDIIRFKSIYNGPSTFVGEMTRRGKLKFAFMSIASSILNCFFIALCIIYSIHLKIFVGPLSLWFTSTIIIFHPCSDGAAYSSAVPCWFHSFIRSFVHSYIYIYIIHINIHIFITLDGTPVNHTMNTHAHT